MAVLVRNLIETPKTLSWAPSADWAAERPRLDALNAPRTRTGPRRTIASAERLAFMGRLRRRSGDALVAVMKAANLRESDDAVLRQNSARRQSR
jgi:hypothetical protein